MDILTIMDTAAELEDRLALLYHLYSKQFQANPRGFAFWEEMSRDEKRHADTARTYRRRRVDLPVTRADHRRIIAEFEAARHEVLKELQRVEDQTITSSIAAAHRLEGLMAHIHLFSVSEVRDPILTKLLLRLGDGDRLHQQRLEKLASGLSLSFRGGTGGW